MLVLTNRRELYVPEERYPPACRWFPCVCSLLEIHLEVVLSRVIR
jgi:hypothetical protein